MIATEGTSDLLNLLLGQGGLLVALLVVIYTGVRKVWVFGWLYAEKVREAETWRELAIRGTTLAERAVTVADGASST